MSSIKAVVIFAGDGIVRQVGPEGVREENVSSALGYDALGARLGTLLRAEVSAFNGTGLPQLGDGTVVLCRSDGLQRLLAAGASGLGRVVLLGGGRSRALRQIEMHGLGAAVESDPFADWVTGRPVEEPALYGRLDVAAALGARPDDEPLTQGERYGRFHLPGVTDVPELLATYLAAASRWG